MVTYLIIIITGLVSILAWKNQAIMEALLFDRSRVQRGEYYRLLSSGLVHLDVSHLLFNLFSFYSFSLSFEYHLGSLATVLIYISSIIVGGFPSLFSSKGFGRALGASGGVAGLIYAHVLLLEGGSIFIFPIPVPIPDWLFAILYIGGSYYLMKAGRSRIGHDAHLAGAFTGVVGALLIAPSILTERTLLLLGLILPLPLIALYFRIQNNRSGR